MQVGQKVFAIGNPFGLDQSLTTGIVDATDREIVATDQPITGVIQTDAAINPGNSGGPLLISARPARGDCCIASQTGTFSGIGFAIPVDTVISAWSYHNSSRKSRPNRFAFLEDAIAKATPNYLEPAS
ncbi:MAG: trypsin-like peptidase domain-containing protein [Gemmataceae bacterium]